MPTRRKNLKKTLRKKLKKSRKLFRGGAAAEENKGRLLPMQNNNVDELTSVSEGVCPTASQIIKYSIPHLRENSKSYSYSLESVRKKQKEYILEQLKSHTLDTSEFPQLMVKLHEMHKKNKDFVEEIIKEVCKIGGPKSFGDASFFLATFLVQMHGTRSALLGKGIVIPSYENELDFSLKCYNYNKSAELKLPTLETLDFERGLRKKMSSCILSLLSLNDNEPPSLALCCLKACIIDPQGNIRMSPDKFNILQIFKIKKDLYKKEIDINNEESVAEFLRNINLCVFYHVGTGNLCVKVVGKEKPISAHYYAKQLKEDAKIERELDFKDFDEVNEILHLINAATRLDSVLHMLSIYNIYSSLASHDMDNVQAPIRNYFIEECLKKMGFIVTKETPISKLFPFNMVTGKTLSGSPVPLAIINNNCQGRIYMVSHILSSISNTNYSPPLSFGMPYTCYTHANMGNIVCGLGFEKKTIEWPNSNLNFSVAAKDNENEHVVYLSFDEKLKEKFDWVPTFMWNDESNLLFIPTEIVSEIGVTIGTIIKRNYGNFHEMMTKPSLSKLKAALNTKLKGYIEGQIFKEYNAIKAQKNSNVFYSFLNKYENFMLAYERIFHDHEIISEPIDDIAEEIISKFLQINKETERLTGIREASQTLELAFTPSQSEQATLLKAAEYAEDVVLLQEQLKKKEKQLKKTSEKASKGIKSLRYCRIQVRQLKKTMEENGIQLQRKHY